jgi:hypothetical protein
MRRRLGARKLLMVGCAIAAVFPFGTAAQTPDAGKTSVQATPPSTQASGPLAGSALYDDVKRYESFGIHRYGTSGANAALDWLAGRLQDAGLSVEQQRFSMGRQYFLDSANMAIDGKTIAVLPQWWIPEDKASFELSAPIAAGNGDATGKFVRLHLPYDQGAYLNSKHRDAINAALDRKPAAVLLTIGHPSGEIFTYNVAQTDTAWPVPVILVAPKDEPLLEAAEQAGGAITVSVKGHYGKDVEGRNVIGRLDRGKDLTVVVSTPVTSWFTSTCERGPGIALFLATASLAARSLPEANFVFVATAGHEIGHGGMEFFLHDRAPKPDGRVVWVHYGASLACYRQPVNGGQQEAAPEVDARLRFLGTSESLAAPAVKAFLNVEAIKVIGDQAAVGELRDIKKAGYPNFFGMFGLHPLFHTPLDSAKMTGPAALEPVARAFADAITEIVNKPPH